MSDRRRCYVAGPMRRWPIHNFPAFFAAEGRLTRAGWEVINPARMTCEAWQRGDVTVSDGTPEACRYFADQDLHAILRVLRAEDGDALVVLPDWEQSSGARAEEAVARWVRLPVLTLEDAVAAGGTKRGGDEQ